MRERLSRLLLACFAAPLLATSGCAGLVLDEDEELPVKNEAGVIAIGQQFGDAIQKENYSAAYELLSARRKSEQSLEQFTTTTKQHRLEYIGNETPTKVDVETYMPYKDEFAEWSDFPADVTYDSLLGFAMVSWTGTVTDPEVGEAQPFGVELDVVVVDEAGQPKIGHIDWADDF